MRNGEDKGENKEKVQNGDKDENEKENIIVQAKGPLQTLHSEREIENKKTKEIFDPKQNIKK